VSGKVKHAERVLRQIDHNCTL